MTKCRLYFRYASSQLEGDNAAPTRHRKTCNRYLSGRPTTCLRPAAGQNEASVDEGAQPVAQVGIFPLRFRYRVMGMEFYLVKARSDQQRRQHLGPQPLAEWKRLHDRRMATAQSAVVIPVSTHHIINKRNQQGRKASG